MPSVLRWVLAFALACALALAAGCQTQQEESAAFGGLHPVLRFHRDSGYFYADDERILLLGVEEPPVWVAFEELRPYPEVVDDFIALLKQSGVNLVVLYRYAPWPVEFLQRLADAGIWLGIQVADVKEPVFGFPETGGAWGTLPDDEFIAEQMESIRSIVSAYGRLPNVAFWWLGGEFVEPVFRADGGRRIREIVRMYADEIRSLDGAGRPITCSRHLLEYWDGNPFSGVTPIDLSDITDFTWITIATHMHLGDFVRDIPGELAWLPVLDAMEDAAVLAHILETAWDMNGRRPLYLGSWSTKAPDAGVCGWSSELTRAQWDAIFGAVPSLGGAYWHVASHIQPSYEPHVLMYLDASGRLQPTDNLEGLSAAYSAAPARRLAGFR